MAEKEKKKKSSKRKKQRFADITKLAKEEKDFVRYRSGHTARNFILILLAVFLVISLLGPEKLGATSQLMLAVFLFLIIVGFLLAYLGKLKENMLSNEFQNLLFASAAGSGVAFFLIIRETNRHIVYYNPACREFLPQLSFDEDAFDNLIQQLQVDKEDWTMLFHQARLGNTVEIPCMVQDTSGVPHALCITLEPIARPDGYIVFKALDEKIKPVGVLPETVVDILPCGAYRTDPKGYFQHANAAFNELLGYRAGEMLLADMNFKDLVFSKELQKESFDTNWEGSFVFKHKEGKPVAVQLQQVILSDQSGGEHHRYGFVVPVVTHVDQPAQGEDSKESLDTIWHTFFETSPMPLVLLDGAGLVTKSNQSFRRLTGMKEDGHSGFLDMLSEESRGGVKALVEQAKQNKIQREPVEITFAQEEDRTASILITALQDNNGKTEHFLAYVTDTTEQKNLELKFVQAQKMQAVGQLAGGIAHDFNNLLTAMIGFCDLLLMRHPAGDQSFPDIMQIKQNANRAANLVRQLLAFSRKQTLQPEVIDVSDSLAELSNLIGRLIGENIELKLEHGSDIWPTKVDLMQLEQVIVNLAVNARDAMPDGGTLTIRTSNVTVDQDHKLDVRLTAAPQDKEIEYGDYVVIEILDTGHGIPQEEVQKIFEPFFTTKEVGEGTGLGLATVYGIIEQTGGHIYVSSQEGQGTTFSIYFKRHEGEIVQKDTDKETTKDLTGSGMVLLVEDEDPVRMFSSRALQNKGYEVLDADCGEAARLILRERGKDIDLIITDVVMPDMTGPTLVKEILPSFPHIRVIFISGYAEDTFVRAYGTDRKFNFLPKPFTLKQLASKVKEVMENDE